MGDEAELLRHDIHVLEQLRDAARDRTEETGDPYGHESVFIQAYDAVLEQRRERLWEVERGRERSR